MAQFMAWCIISLTRHFCTREEIQDVLTTNQLIAQLVDFSVQDIHYVIGCDGTTLPA
jgi:hypothetical protein